MWSNLKNVGQLAQQISNVVAPLEDDSEYEDDEEEYEEEDLYSSSDEQHQQQQDEETDDIHHHSSPLRRPFGLVGMLTQAMDRDEALHDQQHDDDTDPSEPWVPPPNQPATHHPSNDTTAADTTTKFWKADQRMSRQEEERGEEEGEFMNADHQRMREAEGEFVTIHTSDARSPLLTTTEIPDATHTNHSNSMVDISATATAVPSIPSSPHQSMDETIVANRHSAAPKSAVEDSPPQRLSLVRESGSLSPSPTKQQQTIPRATEDGSIALSPLFGQEQQQQQIAPPPLERYSSEEGMRERHKRVHGGGKLPTTTLPSLPLASTPEEAEGGDDQIAANETTRDSAPPDHSASTKRMEKLEKRCKELKRQLIQSEAKVKELEQTNQSTVTTTTNNGEANPTNIDLDQLKHSFLEKEARVLQAANEEHEQELNTLRSQMEEKILSLQRQQATDRNQFQADHEQMQARLNEADHRVEELQEAVQVEQMRNESLSNANEQQHVRTLRVTQDKLAQAMAQLDDRNDQVNSLKQMIVQMESKMNEHHEGAQEAEDEMDELHTENEQLHDAVEKLEAECHRLRNKASSLEADSDKMVHLRMELKMLKEDRDRAQAKASNVAASAVSSTSQLESERDDLKLQLAAIKGDLDVAKSDAGRFMTANANLQAALEAFQNEREAEMAMLEDARKDQERSNEAAHAAALEALKDVHATEIRHIQEAADKAVENSMQEIQQLEEKIEASRVENNQTRRSLDEAIRRLQTTQDDVVDRQYMKNILLDWLTKRQMKEKAQVLELMASVLHFTDDEKSRVHIEGGGSFRSLVAPPPAHADLEHLEGDNVREKFVNFLIAEVED